MATELERYLTEVKENLRLDPSVETEILTELETHAEDRFREMTEAGVPDDEAARECVGLLGSARLVARQIYEAHSQGTWRQALLASVPHFFFSVLFVLRWWDIGWLPVMLGLVLAIAVYGWGHGKPTWLFPWLGYSLLPVIVAGLLLLYLPTGWAWATIGLYVPLVLWLLCYITIKAIRRDWLHSALMLLPVPSLAGWFLAARLGDRLERFSPDRLNEFAPWIGLSFLVLALTVTVFVRLRRRGLRVAILGVSGTLTVLMVAFGGGRLGFPAVLALFALLLIFLSVPALLARRMKDGERPALT
jgi:hypothetical protein